MKYVVYEDGRHAKYPDYVNVDESWDNCTFTTLDEARSYAKNWLGKYDTTPNDWDGKPWVIGGGPATDLDIGVMEIRQEDI